MTLQHVVVAAKIIVTPDGAYVVVGVEAAKMAANVKPRGIATIYSDSTDTTSATSSLTIARDGQHNVSQIISRR
jgi:acyl CoA:acetate/3-ketoacid CoA transferase beta subunit